MVVLLWNNSLLCLIQPHFSRPHEEIKRINLPLTASSGNFLYRADIFG